MVGRRVAALLTVGVIGWALVAPPATAEPVEPTASPGVSTSPAPTDTASAPTDVAATAPTEVTPGDDASAAPTDQTSPAPTDDAPPTPSDDTSPTPTDDATPAPTESPSAGPTTTAPGTAPSSGPTPAGSPSASPSTGDVQPPGTRAVAGDVVLDVSTDCERGFDARVRNRSDEVAEVLVRFSDVGTGEVLLEEPLRIDPDAERAVALAGSEGLVTVTVLDRATEEVLSSGSWQQLRCLTVVEGCDAVEFTNPEDNPYVRLRADVELEDGNRSTTLAPGETLRVDWFDGRWEAVAEGADDVTAGSGFASVSYDTCPGGVGDLTVTCSAADGAGGTLETELGLVEGADVSWRLTRQQGGTVATGTATESPDVRAGGLPVGGYVLDVLVDGERSDRVELRVGTCLTVVTTCSSATFSSAASNPDATIAFFGPLDDPAVRDIDNPNYNVLGIAPGQSVTVGLDDAEHEWRSLRSLASASDPDSPFRGTVDLGTGPLPAAEECPPARPQPVDQDGDEPVTGGIGAGGTGAGGVAAGGSGAGGASAHPGDQLADTGGPAGPLLGAGLLALLGGGALLVPRRR